MYSSFSSIEEVTKGLEKGVYDFIIGDDVLSKVVMSVNSLFQKSETSAYKIDNAKIQQPINSNLFEMIDYYQVQSKSSELNETIAQYNKWYDNSLKAMEKSSLLIVEDEHIFRKLLVDMVRNRNLETKEVVDGVLDAFSVNNNAAKVAAKIFLDEAIERHRPVSKPNKVAKTIKNP